MGAGEWRHDSAKHTLTVELPRGVIALKVDGEKLEGAPSFFPTRRFFAASP
jgi:hypothetical protein